jgi:hypothetical protein
VPIPDGIFYYKPAANVFGSEAAWINPASLVQYNAFSYQIITDYHDGIYGKSWGVVIERQSLAFAYRYLANPEGSNYREYLLAGSTHLGHLFSLGGSYRYFIDGPDNYYKRHYWNLSVTGKTSGPFGWAAVFSNLNRGKLEGQRTEIEQRYSLSYRPTGKQIILSVDAFLSTGQKFKNADFVYHAELMPAKGLFIEGLIDSHQNFQIGLRVNLLRYFVGWQGDFNDNASHLRTTIYAGATSINQPSLITTKGGQR